MNTLNEIIYYCDEKNTTGALLLTGEWGCGKTHLIQEFCETYKNKYTTLKISLFGEISIENIRKKVTYEYLFSLYDSSKRRSKAAKKVVDELYFGEINKALIKVMGDYGKIISSVLSVDFSKHIPIKKYINEKTVVIIFDDLERCRINISDLLGFINEYCENMGLKVIIVANEERLNKGTAYNDSIDENNIYAIIKEKLIARTVHFEGMYDEAIKNIIERYEESVNDYKLFLNENMDLIYDVFAKCSTKNLRSIKHGIADFERIYNVYGKNNYKDHLSESFAPYLQFFIECKARTIIKDTQYNITTNTKTKEIYNDEFLFPALKEWAYSGKWDESQLIEEIKQKIEYEKPMSPKDKLKVRKLLYLTEGEINEGIEPFLRDAYNGLMTTNNYIILLKNLLLAREMEYTFPVDIDYAKLKNGLLKLISSRGGNSRDRFLINEDEREMLLPEEKEIYDIIVEYCDHDFIFETNKDKYLKALNNHRTEELYKLESKRYKAFDLEIANAVFMYYESLKSTERVDFIHCFSRTWNSCVSSVDILIAESMNGIENLLDKINNLSRSSKIEEYIDKMFIDIIKELKNRLLKNDA